MGVSIRPLPQLILSIDHIRTHGKIYYPSETSSGIELKASNWLYLRCGLKTNPSILTFGLGFKINMIDIDYAGTYHPVLPLSHHMSFGISF